MNKIRVLVVDDSAFMRKMISDMINQSDGLEVIDTARNGKVALEKIKQLKPDVVTLDIEMPELDGLQALKMIMDENPVPVIMLSSLTADGTKSTIQSIEYGAVDFLTKPSGSISLDIEKVEKELIQKIKAASTANLQKGKIIHKPQTQERMTFPFDQSIVSIGVSTGGPKALQMLIKDIPSDFPAPILIVQHMPPRFTESLANRLNQIADIDVSEAYHGEILRKGKAYVAPGNYHMEVEKLGTSIVAKMNQNEVDHGHRPSVNQLFKSLAQLKNFNHISVVLTGMGSDGTEGAKFLKSKVQSNYLIAESEETAVIYGMPKSIVEKVGANSVLPIHQIGQTLNELVTKGGIR
ncbi:chemotaxis response regulator protein-glutamate methylesterase [Filobacillus milosensis]|uniref:Protein-glutamate methylesterase/protein-glutamine glutaminase n=1 Tax=Filobacillus milosensis TaxID=94137 RepID=A0A4Y8INN5_9BACI|nr:chemotaxis response regulator protein-glutamate methylesterase [Filobacillus milosensis]TFB23193.1 chemotaxis response regulator protein-glutamate methylesterase [Filobacillus milosensis]